MSEKVFILYKEEDVLANAHSVTLASKDGTYGIKTEGGSVIVSSGTPVENPSVGRYEYSFNPSNGIVYRVSWRVVPNSGDEPQYVTQEIGPFGVASPKPQVSTETRGVFRQGTIGTVIIRISDFDGAAIDPESITYTIVRDSDNEEVVSSNAPEKVKTGIYVFDWEIAVDQEIGKYNVNWTYTIDGEEFSTYQHIIVAEDATDTMLYSGKLLLMKQSLELLLDSAQAHPMYEETSRPSRDNRTFYFTKPLWNQMRGTTIYRNNNIVTEGYSIDFNKGSVRFDEELMDSEVVMATYNFRWFSDDQLDRFISNGLHVVNSFPPVTGYNLATLPDRHIAAVLYSAAVDGIRTLMFNLNWREPAELYGGPERAEQVIKNLEGLKKNYEEYLFKLLEQKKNFPYRGLHRAVVSPEYTLPGGRSRWFRYLFSGSGI